MQVRYTDSANAWHPQKLHLCNLRKELSECTGKRVICVFTMEGSKCAALCSLNASQGPRVWDIVLRVRPAPNRQGPKIRCPMQTRGWFHTPMYDRIQTIAWIYFLLLGPGSKRPPHCSCFVGAWAQCGFVQPSDFTQTSTSSGQVSSDRETPVRDVWLTCV